VICRHFGTCGGCSLPGVPYPEQLARKRRRLAQVLGVAVPPLIPSPREDRFRHKVAFVFGADRRGELVMGHYAAGSRAIVPVDECPVHTDRGNRLAFALRDALARARVDPALLRHVLVRTTDSGPEAAVMLVVATNDRSLRAPVRAFLAGPEPPDGFFININARRGPLMTGPETIRIAGRRAVREDALGPSFLIAPDAFFQTNVGAAREVLRLVLDAAAGARRVLDLYSGGGLFAVPIASAGAQVTAVEENARSVDDAERNTRLNGVSASRIRLVRARVEEAMRRLVRERFDVVILDPPRQGCAPAVLDALAGDVRPPRIVYVSCDPDALGRDLARLRAGGYDLDAVQPVDMFPHTEHIETVVTLARASGRSRAS
jgi:23S rRNA (uracil1939-C5)-methyltransferase